MVTLKDISKVTGISVTQVSRALGGHQDVKAETRNRVIEAAQKSGYRPNAIAKSLKTGRSGLVALILPADADRSTQEALFELLLGLSAELSRRGMKLVLHTAEVADDPIRAFHDLYWSGRMDGFILVEPMFDDPRIRFLTEYSIPHVVHGHDPQQDQRYVDIDNFHVAKRMADHLVKLGHRQIAFANGPAVRTFAQSRASGFRSAIEGTNATWVGEHLSFGAMTRERGRDFLLELHQSGKLPTAIIASNLMLAAGIYDAAKDLGLDIPNDLSILAHNDGLKQYPAEIFLPIVGGTKAPLVDAWITLAREIELAIQAESPNLTGQSLGVEFVEGNSTAKPALVK